MAARPAKNPEILTDAIFLDTSYIGDYGIKMSRNGLPIILIPEVHEEMDRKNKVMQKEQGTGRIIITRQCINHILGITEKINGEPNPTFEKILNRMNDNYRENSCYKIDTVDGKVLQHALSHYSNGLGNSSIVMATDSGIIKATEDLSDFGFNIWI